MRRYATRSRTPVCSTSPDLVARHERVFIDTSELYPFTIMDVLLTLSENLLFTWVWTDELLEEWERVIVRSEQRTPESARSVTDAVRAWFERSRIDPADYRGDITEDLSPDPDDRVHIAACLGGRADVLLTRNTDDFQTERLTDAGVQVMTADEFLVGLLRRRPTAVHDAFVSTAAARRRLPITPCELADLIQRAGAPRFAERMRRRLCCSS
jgi:predicted nucleic acid-binding protein